MLECTDLLSILPDLSTTSTDYMASSRILSAWIEELRAILIEWKVSRAEVLRK